MSTETAVMLITLIAGGVGIFGGLYMLWRTRSGQTTDASDIVSRAPYPLLGDFSVKVAPLRSRRRCASA